jgi:hypothetical protein
LRYRMSWVWNQNLANPYFSFDGREDDLAWCSSKESGELRCTVELDRMIDSGVTDYRIALGLKQAIEKNPRIKSEGQALLKEAADEKTDPDTWRLKVGNLLEK